MIIYIGGDKLGKIKDWYKNRFKKLSNVTWIVKDGVHVNYPKQVTEIMQKDYIELSGTPITLYPHPFGHGWMMGIASEYKHDEQIVSKSLGRLTPDFNYIKKSLEYFESRMRKSYLAFVEMKDNMPENINEVILLTWMTMWLEAILKRAEYLESENS